MELSDNDVEIRLNHENDRIENRRPIYFKSLKNYIYYMLLIRWRTPSYKFIFITCCLMGFSASSIFLSVNVTQSRYPPTYNLINTPLYATSYTNSTIFGPNTREVNDFLHFFKKNSKNNSTTLYDNISIMLNITKYRFYRTDGIYFNRGLSNFTFLTNSLREEMEPKSFNYLSSVILNTYKPGYNFSLKYREYDKPPQVINLDSGMAAFYLIFPFFYMLIISLNSFIQLSTKRQIFSLLINGLPESALWIGNAMIHIIESLPLCFLLVYLITEAYKDYVTIENTLFLSLMLLFIISYSLRFVALSTFIREEKSLNIYLMVIQFIYTLELYSLDFIPQMHPAFHIFLMVFIPQYPLLTAYYIYLRDGKKTMLWNSPKVPGLFTYRQIIIIQIINVISNFFITSIMILMNKRKYGSPLIGWKNIFKKRYWRRIFQLFHVNLSSDQPHVIKLENVSYSYDKTMAIQQMNFCVSPKEVVILIGPNGSGKSTLIDLLVGAIETQSGNIDICGYNLSDVYYEYHCQLGVVFQENTLYDQLTVKDHFLLFSFCIKTNEELFEEMNSLCQLLNLSNVMDSHTESLSGGEKRKLCLALALIQKPKFLIVDEPTSGVDVFCREQIWRVVGNLPETTVIASTHSLEESEYISTRFVVLRKGNVAFSGTGVEMRLEFNSGYNVIFLDEDINIEYIHNRIKEIIPEAKISIEKKKTIVLPSDLRVSKVLDFLDTNEELKSYKYILQIDNLEESLIKIIQLDEGDIHLDID